MLRFLNANVPELGVGGACKGAVGSPVIAKKNNENQLQVTREMEVKPEQQGHQHSAPGILVYSPENSASFQSHRNHTATFSRPSETSVVLLGSC